MTERYLKEFITILSLVVSAINYKLMVTPTLGLSNKAQRVDMAAIIGLVLDKCILVIGWVVFLMALENT